MAIDAEGCLSFLTTSEWQLEYCMKQWPEIKFHKTREVVWQTALYSLFPLSFSENNRESHDLMRQPDGIYMIGQEHSNVDRRTPFRYSHGVNSSMLLVLHR